MLWPDTPDSTGLANLRRSLRDLRRVLGVDAWRLTAPTPRTLRLDLSGVSVDVLEFDQALDRKDAASLAEAVALYRAPLLAECDEDWVLPERARREQAYLQALDLLAAHARDRGDAAAAIGYLRRAILVDPLRESLHCALMEVLAAAGDYAAATHVYRDLRAALYRELNAAPSAETVALFERLRADGRRRAGEGISSSRPETPRASPKGHLPHPLSTLIGREQELREVRARLEGARLVTLTGPGGVGKTRLAIRVAREQTEGCSDGAWFVDLAAQTDPAHIVDAIAAALGLREEPGRPLDETLLEWLRPQSLLLVLDSCEHLLDACARLAERILLGCGDVRVLATSREPLGVTGEVVWAVPSLPAPPLSQLRDTDKDQAGTWIEYDAVRLFATRAAEAQSQFRLDRETLRAAAEVCCRLDGIPLAIELAAARLRTLTVQEVAARLDDRFRLLTKGGRTAPPRQQTLRSLIDWSYDLLSEAEKVLLCRLSVFAGGWTLEAAEKVCSGAGDVLDLLTALVDRSLVVHEAREGGGRHQMLETVRQYARERLAEAGETVQLRERHRAFFLEVAETASANLQGPDQASWFARLDQEQDNLWAALDGCLPEVEATEAGLRLATALSDFWSLRGSVARGREVLEALLARCSPSARTPTQARALRGAGRLAYDQGDFGAARAYSEQSLALWRGLADPPGIADCLIGLAAISRSQSDYATAADYYEESRAIYREIGDRPGTAWAADGLAVVRYYQGEYPAARELAEASLAIRRELGDSRGISMSLSILAAIAIQSGEYAAARDLEEEGLALCRQVGDRQQIAYLLHSLGELAYGEGESERAADLAEEALAVWRELRDEWGIAQARQILGLVALARGEIQRAAALLHESLATWQRLHDRRGIAWAQLCLGKVALHQGDWAGARRQYEESLAARRDLEDRYGMAECLEELGELSFRQGEGPESVRRAARLWGAAAAMRTSIGSSMLPARQGEHDRLVAAARVTLGEAAFQAALLEGGMLGQQQALALALEERPLASPP